MNNYIQEDYVSFEVAKLLHKYGFKSKSRYYNGSGDLVESPDIPENDYRHTNNEMQRFRWEAPTQALAVKWLYENFGIWIYTKPSLDEDGEWIFKGYVKLINDFKSKEFQTKLCRMPQEAIESALEYTLKNLINHDRQ